MDRIEEDAFRVAVENEVARQMLALRKELARDEDMRNQAMLDFGTGIFRMLCFTLGCVIVFLAIGGVANWAFGQDIEGWISAPGYEATQFKLRRLAGPTPAPTSVQPTPARTPPPAGGCPHGSLNRPLPDGGTGILNVTLAEGEQRVWCLTLPQSYRTLVVNEYDQCLGTNVSLVLSPPVGARFSDGKPVPETSFRSTMRLGSSRSPTDYVPAGTYLLRVVGGAVGPNCNGNVSAFSVRFYVVE